MISIYIIIVCLVSVIGLTIYLYRDKLKAWIMKKVMEYVMRKAMSTMMGGNNKK